MMGSGRARAHRPNPRREARSRPPGPMTEKDQVKPFHAKEASSGQEAADAVADVLKHAAERDDAARKAEQKAAPKGNPKWMLPLAMNLGVLAVYFLVAQPTWTQVNPIQTPPSAERIANLRTAMLIDGINRIESFRQNNGRLPTSLEEAGASPGLISEVVYQTRGESAYTLIGSVEEEDIVFDSATMTQADFIGGRINLPG